MADLRQYTGTQHLQAIWTILAIAVAVVLSQVLTGIIEGTSRLMFKQR